MNAAERGTDHDCTVLHRLACFYGGATQRREEVERARLPMVEWLLDRGADPTIRDPEFGADASGWARHHGMEAMAQRLAAHASGGRQNG